MIKEQKYAKWYRKNINRTLDSSQKVDSTWMMMKILSRISFKYVALFKIYNLVHMFPKTN